MAQWMEVKKIGSEVLFVESQNPVQFGVKYGLGVGSIELRDTLKAGLHFVRFSNTGRFKYAMPLKRDGVYRLGSSYGHFVKPVEEEKDPIKRLLREMEIPVSILEYSSEKVMEMEEYYYDNSHCPNGRNTHNWEHDGRESDHQWEETRPARGYFEGAGYRRYSIEGASYAIRFDSGRYLGGANWTRPSRVVIFREVDPATLGDKLAPVVYGYGTDHRYTAALKDPQLAAVWLAEIQLEVKIGVPSPQQTTLVYQGMTVSFWEPRAIGWYHSTCWPVLRLLQAHGVGLKECLQPEVYERLLAFVTYFGWEEYLHGEKE